MLAQRVCADCHAVQGHEALSPNARAPTFQQLASTPGVDQRGVDRGLHDTARGHAHVQADVRAVDRPDRLYPWPALALAAWRRCFGRRARPIPRAMIHALRWAVSVQRVTHASSLFALFLLATGSTAGFGVGGFRLRLVASFAAIRNGQTIGHHSLTFQKTAPANGIDRNRPCRKIHGRHSLPLCAPFQEVWSGDTFLALTAHTDDNGKKYAIQIRRDGAALTLERNAPPDVLSAATLDRGLKRDGAVRTTLPPHLLPSTHWNVRQIRQSALVNTQTAPNCRTGFRSRPGDNPDGACVDRCNALPLHRRLLMDQWFDDAGRWVKTSFTASTDRPSNTCCSSRSWWLVEEPKRGLGNAGDL